LDLIKTDDYQNALILLEFLPYEACGPVGQVLRSAVANAEYRFQFNKKDLRIKEIYVNSGPVMRRVRSRAQGRSCIIRKPSSHITVVVEVQQNNKT
jgi:large subunit ribosomal protein L22